MSEFHDSCEGIAYRATFHRQGDVLFWSAHASHDVDDRGGDFDGEIEVGSRDPAGDADRVRVAIAEFLPYADWSNGQ